MDTLSAKVADKVSTFLGKFHDGPKLCTILRTLPSIDLFHVPYKLSDSKAFAPNRNNSYMSCLGLTEFHTSRFRWNYLNVAPLRDIYDRWINQYASPSVELLTRLKRDLEN